MDDLTLDAAIATANEHIARINGNTDLNSATWEEQKKAEAKSAPAETASEL